MDRGFAWVDALAYCDGLTWAGYSDWRLPDEYELQSIVDYGRTTAPAMDPSAFPAVDPVEYLWSSTSAAVLPSYAWIVDFFTSGRITPEPSWSENSVRCARRDVPYAGVPVARFARTEPVPGYPVVVDAATGLVWQGCAVGQAGGDCAGSAYWPLWQDALDDCQDLTWAGFTDWYLPNVDELRSIVDDRRGYPSIDADAFPATGADFWSSTPCTGPFGRDGERWMAVWFVDFEVGDVMSGYKVAGQYQVRCVRRGP
jgi:hypothetical protein